MDSNKLKLILNDEYHPDYSSNCMCGYCQFNKNLNDRIHRFISNEESRLGYWSKKRKEWRKRLVLG